MIQEKYNQLIYDTATNEAIETYSHIRSNVMSVISFKKTDKVTLLNPEIIAVKEELETKVEEVAVELTSERDYVIGFGKLTVAPSKVKANLSEGGAFVMASDDKECDREMLETLCRDAGYTDVQLFFAAPDYRFTTELFSPEYTKDNYSSYILIAR